jgi:hypothetical protein
VKRESSEFEKFDKTMRALLAVPHSELKKKLDAEKRQKRRKKQIKISASHGAGAV